MPEIGSMKNSISYYRLDGSQKVARSPLMYFNQATKMDVLTLSLLIVRFANKKLICFVFRWMTVFII